MPQRNPDDMCPCGQRHCHRQRSASYQPLSGTELIPETSESRNQLQHAHAQSTGATCIAPTPNRQRRSNHVSYRQSIPYWDDFNGIIYEIPYGKLLSPSKTSSQQADGGRNAEPQSSCAEIAGDRPYGEDNQSRTVLSPSGTTYEYMPDRDNVKALDIAPCVDVEETRSKGCLPGSKKHGVYANESAEKTL
ncbi:hypothetical protein COCVIDRAFT_85268 [Bipolaris victoriae FI3]|uniref:Uncharacterized protein n=1 Tax=Bipolaris victoriae (strain FI3) TaxID=930091 RepID=W7F944_BIPV3|nr:hypothetical protein COCVIDRAFT_85268 [Bipolaris victoriae FI3]